MTAYATLTVAREKAWWPPRPTQHRHFGHVGLRYCAQSCQLAPPTVPEPGEGLGDTNLVSRGASSHYSWGSAALNWTGSTWPHKANAS